ncbi:Cell wall-associated hydrolase, NlpC family [Lentibacillus halodurans]|uniref:Cell wall-associated hydrolase, NlpC family n=1 Tax=Lentibacillus halodurans TaxID=237679 RepID=A0A1I0VEC8_9BACI|nr:NlpC/P60 family protein [Lentibacillus halodurans]SFA74632.1 Cell wall-associated hydrolase, NlpC family [Lentibacillus halodurans]
MLNGTIEHVVKQSVLYSYVLSQPFAVYVDAYPVLQNEQLLEAEQQLQYGQHGETVRILQQKLNKLSYFDDKIDGDYGVLTEHALKKFQANHELKITGQVNMKTLNTVIDEEKRQYKEQLEDLSGSIHPGMESSDVKIVQRALEYFGYYKGEIDGIYGPLTQQALEAAEEEHDTELIDHDALKALYEDDQSEQQNQQQDEQEGKQDEKQTTKEESSHEAKQVEVKSTNYPQAIEAARNQIGTPYVWGGESPSGFDCSGFIQYIFQVEGISLPRTVSDTWNFTTQVESPSVGDLVFFETYKPGPSHMGIYIGDGQFIHAGESRGVEISKMNNSYWEKRYLGAGRVQ